VSDLGNENKSGSIDKMKKSLKIMLGSAMVVCLFAQSTAYGLNRSWKGTDSVNPHLMSRDGNWVGVAPDSGDIMQFNGSSTGSGTPSMNRSFLVELVRAQTALAQDIKMGGNAANQLRLRSTAGLAMENNSGQEFWININGNFRQDNDIDGTSDNAAEVTWRTAAAGSVLKVTPATITLEMDLKLEVDGVSSMEIGGAMSGYTTAKNWDITKVGTGTLTFSGSSVLTGDMIISNGTVRLGANQAISSASDIIFETGTTLETGGFDCDFKTLDVNGTVEFDFESLATSQISFKDSSAVAWGTTLNITNFTVGSDTIRFGTDTNGLTEVQLAGITINGDSVEIDSSGYLAPAAGDEPDPIVLAIDLLPSGDAVAVTWNSSNSVVYDLEYKTNLTAGTWMNETNIVSTGGDITVTSSVDKAEKFYQVTTP
jgi:autotransporter-associated beta strand protein